MDTGDDIAGAPSSERQVFVPARLNVVLVEPEIPPNTGNVGRLCLSVGARLHLIEPLGFSLDEKQLRRAGMDYWPDVDLKVWPNLETLNEEAGEEGRFWYFTTKTDRRFWDARFEEGDYLVFGRETKGLPEGLLGDHPDQCVTIPMGDKGRSLNLATSVGIGVFESLRQLL